MTTDLLDGVQEGTGHDRCLMCGSNNPLSFNLNFDCDENNRVSATFQSHEWLQGYSDILHGGITSALLDAAMTNCLFKHKIKAVTGDLRIRFLAPIPCDACVELTAFLDSQTPPLYIVKAELCYNGQVMARAKAKFMKFSAL